MDHVLARTFVSQEALLEALQAEARLCGYALVKRRSKAGKQVVLCCDRGGKHVPTFSNPDGPQRQSSSRKTGCMFEIYASVQGDGLWHALMKNSEHNHECTPADIAAHPSHRKLTEASRTLVHALAAAGAPPSATLLALKQQDPSNATLAKDITNATAQWRRTALDGLSPLQALLRDADMANWISAFDSTPNNSLKGLFLMHKSSLDLFNLYHHVVVLDSTYRTTRTKMPLLHIVGMTATNKTFTIAVVYLIRETTECFTWALLQLRQQLQVAPRVAVTDRDAGLISALATVFPDCTHLLCFWHIEKNVLSHAKRAFGTNISGFDELMQQWKQFQSHSEYSSAMAQCPIRHRVQGGNFGLPELPEQFRESST